MVDDFQISYPAGGYLVTLTGMTAGPGTPDLVDYYTINATGAGDTITNLTLTVAAVPEPSSFALGCGIAVGLAGLLRRKLLIRPA